jgi:hypothetical protein
MTKYLIYEEYSTHYIIDLSQDFPTEEIAPWLEEHCYYVLSTSLISDFHQKVKHNLSLARSRDDRQYLTYLMKKFNIVVDPQCWDYQPPKIRIQLKKTTVSGWTMGPSLVQLLNPSDPIKVYQYRSEIVRLVHQYIYQHQLQNRYDRQTITPDNSLQTVLTPLSSTEIGYTYYNLPQHLMDLIHEGVRDTP